MNFGKSPGTVRANDDLDMTVEADQKLYYRATSTFMGKNEKFGVFSYSDRERAIAVATVKDSIDEQMAARAGELAQIGNLTGRTSRATRRTSKLLGG